MKFLLLLSMGLLPLLPVSVLAAPVTAAPRVALVFDDGPAPEQAEKLLAVLAQADIKVTFSYVGRAVEAHPELARATALAGHEINNHSHTHPHLRLLPDEEVICEVSRTSAAILQATGRSPVWFWAPFLEADNRVDRLVREATGLVHFPLGQYHFITTDDWNVAETDAAKIVQRATTDIRDQTVILFHEWRPETLVQLPLIIAELRRQGCVFLTLSALNRHPSGSAEPSPQSAAVKTSLPR